MNRHIDLSKDTDYKKFIIEYEKAVNNNHKEFTYECNLLLVTYAKYLIEYVNLERQKRGMKIYNNGKWIR